MIEELVPYEIAKLAIEKGFSDYCYTRYSNLRYPTDDSGNNFNECKCAYIVINDQYNSVEMLWIEDDLGSSHWNEGTYSNGEHSRCEIVGEEILAPSCFALQAWIMEIHNIDVYAVPVKRHHTDGSDYYYYTWRIYKEGRSGKIYDLFKNALKAGLKEALELIPCQD